MSIQIQVLSDNHSAPKLSQEHGYSLFIEQGDHSLLFDTGASKQFYLNASAMRIPLEKIHCLVLSHGHYDHTGGLEELLRHLPHVPIFAHASVLLQRFSLHEDSSFQPVGMSPLHQKMLQSLPTGQWTMVEEKQQILPGIFAVSSIDKPEKDLPGTRNFFLDEAGKKADRIPDDLSLLIREDSIDHLICGCCHSGLLNTLNHLEKHFSSLNLHSLMGGFHLSHASDDEIRALGKKIEKMQIKRLICSHCTGDRAFELWARELSIPVEQSYAGKSYLLS